MKRNLFVACYLLISICSLAQNVGIGTNLPAYPLDINGRVRIRQVGGNSSGIWYNKTDNSLSSFVGQFNDTVFGIYNNDAGSWRFGFDHKNTRLGINTLTPQYPLTFANTVGDKISLWGGSTPGTNHYGFGIQGSQMQLFTPGNGDDISFGHGRSNSFTETFRFTGDGKLGIGTTNPGYPVTIVRNGGGDGLVQTNSFNNVTMGTYVGADAGWLQTITNHPLHFATGNSQPQMTLETNGKLGLGITGSVASLHVKNNNSNTLILENSAALASTIENELLLKTGNYYTGAIKTRGTASNSASLEFYTFSSTDMNNLQKRMTIADGGNIGIGTEPAAAAKVKIDGGSGVALEVNGAIRMTGAVNSKPAFVLVCDATNLTDIYNPPINYTPADYHQSVIINNTLCNNDPNAIVMITPVGNMWAFGVFYDNALGRWKITVYPHGQDVSTCYGTATPKGGVCGNTAVAVMGYEPMKLNVGDKFNVLIIKQ